MFKNITTGSAFFVAAVLLFTGCKKTEYSFGGKFYLPDNFEMTAQGIRFTYNPYEVSNWANGIVEFVLPTRQLKPYLKREI